MFTQREIDEFRADAESRMSSRTRSWRRTLNADGTPATTTNADGYEVPAWEIPHPDIPCRLASKTGAGQSRTVSTAGGDVQVASRELHLPASTTDVHDGDLFEITEGENAGTVWQVVEADGADQKTALRLPVVAAQRPEEW